MYTPLKVELRNVYGLDESLEAMRVPKKSKGDSIGRCSWIWQRTGCWLGIFNKLGKKDAKLAKGLIISGDDHAKFVRGVLAYVKLEMQIGWMIEFETYRHGVECLSTSSSMHGELKHLHGVELAEKKQADLPDKVYTRFAYISYQALRRMHRARRNHRHPDWQIFCDFIEELPYFERLIMPDLVK